MLIRRELRKIEALLDKSRSRALLACMHLVESSALVLMDGVRREVIEAGAALKADIDGDPRFSLDDVRRHLDEAAIEYDVFIDRMGITGSDAQPPPEDRKEENKSMEFIDTITKAKKYPAFINLNDDPKK